MIRSGLLDSVLSMRFLLLPFLSLCFAAGPVYSPPFGKWQRLSDKPVLSPVNNQFESAGVFNPAIIKRDNKYIMLYRSQNKTGTSFIGYASSLDGVHFTRRSEPALFPEADYERNGGLGDPRVIKAGNTYYLTYTGYNNKVGQLCLATSHNLLHWVRKGVLLPAYKGRWNVGWTKSGAILDQKTGGRYWMYFMGDSKGHPGQMGVAWSTDLLHWNEPLAKPVAGTRAGMFDSKSIEPGPPPVVTPQGILLIYNGADDQFVYRTGWLLFDRSDPAKVIARSDTPVFEPGLGWEKTGQVPNVVFVEGLIREPKRWLFYYGAAGKHVGVASAPAF